MEAFVSTITLSRSEFLFRRVATSPLRVAARGAGQHLIMLAFRSRPSRSDDKFESFDGSLPLLPPWRPSSPEEDFVYHGRRARAREQAAQSFRRIVSVSADGDTGDVLFAEVIQDTQKEGTMWVRPLLMRNQSKDTLLDMRGTIDILLPSSCVAEPDLETRTFVSMSVAASEHDFYNRFLGDDSEIQENCRLLNTFVQSLRVDD